MFYNVPNCLHLFRQTHPSCLCHQSYVCLFGLIMCLSCTVLCNVLEFIFNEDKLPRDVFFFQKVFSIIFLKEQTNTAISFYTAYVVLEVCPACIVQCLPIILQYFFRYYKENRTSKLKQEPQDYIVQHLCKLAVTLYMLLLSSMAVHKETRIDLEQFFPQNFSAMLKDGICTTTDSHLALYMSA